MFVLFDHVGDFFLADRSEVLEVTEIELEGFKFPPAVLEIGGKLLALISVVDLNQEFFEFFELFERFCLNVFGNESVGFLNLVV